VWLNDIAFVSVSVAVAGGNRATEWWEGLKHWKVWLPGVSAGWERSSKGLASDIGRACAVNCFSQ
tara:strand:- start:139 stop:333 length:195 start_codon:yes stop_codon:yes gene_type:complete